MVERLECWTCNPEDPSSSPTLTASWICFTENLSFKSSAMLVNSQLVCLRPVGILNPVMFNLYVDLIIYSMTLKSLDGALSLEVALAHQFSLSYVFFKIEKFCLLLGCVHLTLFWKRNFWKILEVHLIDSVVFPLWKT